MFRGENRISFNIFSESTQTFEAKFYAFATMSTDLHRWHGYRVRFNDDPYYPQILERIENCFCQHRRPKKRDEATNAHLSRRLGD